MKKLIILLILVVFGLAACNQATPETIVQTVEVEKVVTVEVEKEVEVEKVVTVEVEKVVTVEVTRVVVEETEVPAEETVEAEEVAEATQTPTATPLPTATPTLEWENAAQKLILDELTFVQDNGEGAAFRFTCAGNGIYGAQDFASTLSLESEESIFIIPNAGNLDLWGEAGGYKLYGDNTVEFVPRTGQNFQDPDDSQLYEILSLDETLELATAEELSWVGGKHGDAGLVAECDPQYQAD